MMTAYERMMAQERRASDQGRVAAAHEAVAVMEKLMPYRR